MYENIIDALRRGAADEALAAARQAVADQPQDPDAHRLLASAMRLGGDVAGALAVVDKALADAPENADLHMARGGLLLSERKLDEAQAALARSLGLDPNQFPAYILQAHLALNRGDLDEASRLARVGSRLAPDHPQIMAIDGTVALHRGQRELALKLLALAHQNDPGDASLLPALGYAYMANGHFAFAEQTFRSLLERNPGASALQALIAEIIRRQGRPGDAADMLAPLAAREDASPALRRAYARMEIQARRPERALPLITAAFQRNPEDVPTLEALVDLWHHGNQIDLARQTLEPVLATHPHHEPLWHARLAFEPYASEAALAVVERWLQAMPDYVPALEARAAIHDAAGETDQADEIAYQIAALDPGRLTAELRIVESLLRRDPPAAAAHVEGLIAKAQDPTMRLGLRQLLGRTQAGGGNPAGAVATWMQIHTDVLAQRLPLPPLTDGPAQPLPPQAEPVEGRPGVMFLWGPPGSMVESLAATLQAGGVPLLTDRSTPRAPQDPLQRYATAQELRDGLLAPQDFIAQWRAALPARGVGPGAVFDSLLWWDNALVNALRAHLGEGVLVIGLRDPRDMLVDWLAWGPINSPFGLASPEAGARWLVRMLEQLFELHQQNLFRHVMVPLDTISHQPQALASALNQALGLKLPPPPPQALGMNRNVPGAWRTFAEPLAEAFALLTPMAVKFGYPQD